MAARQQRSAAIVTELFKLWEKELPRMSGKSKLAEAIRYATSRRKALECFLIDGRVEIGFQHRRTGDTASNDHAQERAVRGTEAAAGHGQPSPAFWRQPK